MLQSRTWRSRKKRARRKKNFLRIKLFSCSHALPKKSNHPRRRKRAARKREARSAVSLKTRIPRPKRIRQPLFPKRTWAGKTELFQPRFSLEKVVALTRTIEYNRIRLA